MPTARIAIMFKVTNVRAMLTKLSPMQAGTLGELLAVAKLNSLGHAAYISPEGAPGHDVIVVVDNQAKSIEVKTRQFLKRTSEISRWPVNMNTKGDADFFLFIELEISTLSPTFYLLTNKQARETYVESGGGNCLPSKVRSLATANDFSALGYSTAVADELLRISFDEKPSSMARSGRSRLGV
jgi:hypothetical protein